MVFVVVSTSSSVANASKIFYCPIVLIPFCHFMEREIIMIRVTASTTTGAARGGNVGWIRVRRGDVLYVWIVD